MSCCHSSFELLLLLGTWPSACYQRVDVLSQLLDIHSAFELLLGTWPCACYQSVDVLSQLFDSSLHVGFRNYQSSPTRRARTENKKVNCYQRVDVLSQLFDSSLHVGFRNYQLSPTRRARTENKKVNDHSRSSVNTREVSEGSMGGVSH